MNWDVIAAVSEFVGAIAVVVSLLYVAVQIKHGTKTAEDAAFRDVFAAFSDHMHAMMEEPNRKIILKGLLDYRALSGDEKFVFDASFTTLLTLTESSIISNAADLVKDETMDNWGEYLITRYFAYEGVRQWWNDSKSIYLRDLQIWLDAVIGDADLESDFWNIKERQK